MSSSCSARSNCCSCPLATVANVSEAKGALMNVDATSSHLNREPRALNQSWLEGKLTLLGCWEGVMQQLTAAQGAFELTLLNAECARDKFDDLVIEGLSLGIPAEIMTRLEAIWSTTRQIAGEVITVGRIVVRQILAFIKAHPGIAIGVAIGAAIGGITAAIPFIGPLLAPITTSAAVLMGAAVGATVDSGSPSSDPLVAAIQLARKFFEFIQSVFLAVRDYYSEV